MEVTVKLNKIRTSPRKIRPVLPIIRGKKASLALDILKFTNKGIAPELYQLVKSGIAASKEKEMNEENIFIKEVKCDQGSTLKRHIYVSRGRASRISKRSSHLTITISDQFKTPVTKQKADSKEAVKEIEIKKEDKKTSIKKESE